MDDQQRQQFRVIYSSVMTAAIYSGTFLTCFFWPSFLAYLFFPEHLTRTEFIAIFIFLPTGLTILGVLDGLKLGILHFVGVATSVVFSSLLILGIGRDTDIAFAKTFLVAVIAMNYMGAALLASKRRIQAY